MDIGVLDQSVHQLRPAGAPVTPITYSIEDAVTASGLARSRLYALMGLGEIETRKIGRRTMILARSLADYIERQPPASIRPPKGT